MNFGEEHRVYKETSIHEHSSRSHTIFRVYVERLSKSSDGASKTQSMLNLVDLAGSERLNEFEHRKDTLGETGHINKSLFILANVINKLAEGKAMHIPYRDSKLTRILSQALGGNSLTAIIATISPASMNYYQTLSTLRFATRAKTVKNKPIVNEYTDDSELVKIYKEEIRRMKETLQVKNSEINHYQQKQLEMQYHLQNNVQQQTPVAAPEDPMLESRLNEAVSELEKERNEKEKLQEELVMVEEKNTQWIKQHLEEVKRDRFETFFQSSIVQIEEILEEQMGNTD